MLMKGGTWRMTLNIIFKNSSGSTVKKEVEIREERALKRLHLFHLGLFLAFCQADLDGPAISSLTRTSRLHF